MEYSGWVEEQMNEWNDRIIFTNIFILLWIVAS